MEVVRVAEAEAVEVGDDRDEREAEADEALPALGDWAADALAALLVEDEAGRGAGDDELRDVDGDVVVVDLGAEPIEERAEREDRGKPAVRGPGRDLLGAESAGEGWYEGLVADEDEPEPGRSDEDDDRELLRLNDHRGSGRRTRGSLGEPSRKG